MKTLMVNTHNPRALAQIIERIESARNTTVLDGSNPGVGDALVLVDEIYRLRKELDNAIRAMLRAAPTPKGTLVLRSNT